MKKLMLEQDLTSAEGTRIRRFRLVRIGRGKVAHLADSRNRPYCNGYPIGGVTPLEVEDDAPAQVETVCRACRRFWGYGRNERVVKVDEYPER